MGQGVVVGVVVLAVSFIPQDCDRLALSQTAYADLTPPITAAPGFEPGPTEVTARSATVLRQPVMEEREGFEPSRQRRAPAYLDSNQAPSARLGYLSKEEGE
jgi:hypothetical protein